jgi:hypothetical protein
MTKQAGPDWAQIRHRYEETQDPVAEICRGAGITERDLANARKKGKWRRKHPRPFPPPRSAPAEFAAESPTLACHEDRGGMQGGAIAYGAPRVTTPSSSQGRPSELAGSPPPRGEGSGVGGQSGARRGGALPVPATAIQSEAALENECPATDEIEPAPSPEPASPAAAPPAIPRRLLATPAARRRLLERLVAAISMKLEQLERRMSIDLASAEDTTATDHERETRAIGALIDNLEKIRELEAGLAQNVGKSGPPTTDLADEADRCRRELAERLSRLVGAAAKGT